jgi:hypothetical protein
MLTDPFLVNIAKSDRNLLFRASIQADQGESSGLKNDLYAFGMILFEFGTCQVIEKSPSVSNPEEIRTRVLNDLEKDELLEKYQKSIIAQCLLPSAHQPETLETELLKTFETILCNEQYARTYTRGEIGLSSIRNRLDRVAVINTDDVLDLEFGPLLCSTNKRELVSSKVEVKRMSYLPILSKVLLEERNRLECVSMLSNEKLVALCRKPYRLLEIDLASNTSTEYSKR